jgi:hypothetical protein
MLPTWASSNHHNYHFSCPGQGIQHAQGVRHVIFRALTILSLRFSLLNPDHTVHINITSCIGFKQFVEQHSLFTFKDYAKRLNYFIPHCAN